MSQIAAAAVPVALAYGQYKVNQYISNVANSAYNQMSVSASNYRKAAIKDLAKRLRPEAVPRNRMGALRASSDEVKSVDLPYAVYGMDATGSVTAINLIRTGSTFTNRIGRRIRMKSLYINGIMLPQAATVAPTYARFIIVYDKQANGTLPAFADVVTSHNQATTASVAAEENLNLNNRDRFKVIVDKRFFLPGSTAGVSQGAPSPAMSEMKIQEYRRLKMLDTQYKADSSPAVIGDIATGSLLMLTYGTQTVGTGYNLGVSLRLRFVDN